MNKVEIFDMVYRGLEAQGFTRSVNENGKCMYRGLEGKKCAAGHLLPDNAYEIDMEGASVHYLSWFRENFDDAVMNLIDQLQRAHDLSTGPQDMKARLNAVLIN